MKRLSILLAAGALVSFSFATAAAQLASPYSDSGVLRPAGTVSASGAANLDDLQQQLAQKAREQGAKGYTINAAGGVNKLYGTATIYK